MSICTKKQLSVAILAIIFGSSFNASVVAQDPMQLLNSIMNAPMPANNMAPMPANNMAPVASMQPMMNTMNSAPTTATPNTVNLVTDTFCANLGLTFRETSAASPMTTMGIPVVSQSPPVIGQLVSNFQRTSPTTIIRSGPGGTMITTDVQRCIVTRHVLSSTNANSNTMNNNNVPAAFTAPNMVQQLFQQAPAQPLANQMIPPPPTTNMMQPAPLGMPTDPSLDSLIASVMGNAPMQPAAAMGFPSTPGVITTNNNNPSSLPDIVPESATLIAPIKSTGDATMDAYIRNTVASGMITNRASSNPTIGSANTNPNLAGSQFSRLLDDLRTGDSDIFNIVQRQDFKAVHTITTSNTPTPVSGSAAGINNLISAVIQPIPTTTESTTTSMVTSTTTMLTTSATPTVSTAPLASILSALLTPSATSSSATRTSTPTPSSNSTAGLPKAMIGSTVLSNAGNLASGAESHRVVPFVASLLGSAAGLVLGGALWLM